MYLLYPRFNAGRVTSHKSCESSFEKISSRKKREEATVIGCRPRVTRYRNFRGKIVRSCTSSECLISRIRSYVKSRSQGWPRYIQTPRTATKEKKNDHARHYHYYQARPSFIAIPTRATIHAYAVKVFSKNQRVPAAEYFFFFY